MGSKVNSLSIEVVEKAIQTFAAVGIPRLDEVASLVGSSPRTLHRFLAEQDLKFTGVVACSRKQMAKELLGTTDLPISDIAKAMGQPDVSNFGRSFRKWTGQSPALWRKTHAHLRGNPFPMQSVLAEHPHPRLHAKPEKN